MVVVGGGGDFSQSGASFEESSFPYQNETLVLECFDHDVVGGTVGVDDSSFGVVITSRKMFRAVQLSHLGQLDDGVLCCTDNTYKFHYGARGCYWLCWATLCGQEIPAIILSIDLYVRPNRVNRSLYNVVPCGEGASPHVFRD